MMAHKQTGNLLDTNQGSQGSKWIFVMSTSKNFYAGEVKADTNTKPFVDRFLFVPYLRCNNTLHYLNTMPYLLLPSRKGRDYFIIPASLPEGQLWLLEDLRQKVASSRYNASSKHCLQYFYYPFFSWHYINLILSVWRHTSENVLYLCSKNIWLLWKRTACLDFTFYYGIWSRKG